MLQLACVFVHKAAQGKQIINYGLRGLFIHGGANGGKMQLLKTYTFSVSVKNPITGRKTRHARIQENSPDKTLSIT